MTTTRDHTRTDDVEGGERSDLRALALDLTDTVAEVLGSPDAQRVTHHKGIVLAGTFTPTPRARELSRAVHLQGGEVPVTVRFSNGLPGAEGRDTLPGDPRGMAVKFTLPDGSTTDLVCQDWPVFPAGTPEDFRDLLRAQHAGEEATAAFLAGRPGIVAAGELVATVAAPPRSFATVVYHSLNAFRLVDAGEGGHWVRWRLEPEAGEHRLSESDLAGRDPDYLVAGILDELPVRFRVIVQVAAEGDDVTDPSRAWPADRELVELGSIELTAPDTMRERDGDVLVHDPMRLVDGIEPSDDPILRIRPYVYAESVRRRSGAACPVHLR